MCYAKTVNQQFPYCPTGGDRPLTPRKSFLISVDINIVITVKMKSGPQF